MSWFTDLFKRKAQTEEPLPPPVEKEPIHLDELSEIARSEVERLTREALRKDATLQDINRINETIDAVVEQDRRERAYYERQRDWSETARPSEGRPIAKRSLSSMSVEELRELEQLVEAQREWTLQEEKLQKTRRWGSEAGTLMGTDTKPAKESKNKDFNENAERDQERKGRRIA